MRPKQGQNLRAPVPFPSWLCPPRKMLTAGSTLRHKLKYKHMNDGQRTQPSWYRMGRTYKHQHLSSHYICSIRSYDQKCKYINSCQLDSLSRRSKRRQDFLAPMPSPAFPSRQEECKVCRNTTRKRTVSIPCCCNALSPTEITYSATLLPTVSVQCRATAHQLI